MEDFQLSITNFFGHRWIDMSIYYGANIMLIVDIYTEPHTCSDKSPIVIGVVVAVVIVLLGSVANYIIWKTNNG